uniref:Cytohesin 2 n=2 Tax=Artiodactyla TaxID=91561 RepID=A0A8D1A9I2_PIG
MEDGVYEPPDLTPEERMELENIRRRKQELLVEIQRLREELSEAMSEVEGLEANEGSKTLQRNRKMAMGRKKFNMDPKKGIQFLVEDELLQNTPEEIARFLYKGEGLNKTAIGDYLGEREELNLAVLHAFVDLHEFTDLNLVQALRQFLWSFRLPGEAQKIDRMMEAFAQRYCLCNPGVFQSTDTCYVLSFAVIMLNTSLHNPNVRDKPGLERFVAMNRGINEGGDLPEELLRVRSPSRPPAPQPCPSSCPASCQEHHRPRMVCVCVCVCSRPLGRRFSFLPSGCPSSSLCFLFLSLMGLLALFGGPVCPCVAVLVSQHSAAPAVSVSASLSPPRSSLQSSVFCFPFIPGLLSCSLWGSPTPGLSGARAVGAPTPCQVAPGWSPEPGVTDCSLASQNLYDSIRNEPFKIPEDDGNDLTHTFFNPDREGWLLKLGGRVKTWKRRWFILTDNCLYYFEYTTDKEPRGIIPLENLSIREVDDPRKPNCFELYIPNNKGQLIKACKTEADGRVVEGNHMVYRISAPTQEEKDEWIKSIQAAVSVDPFYEMLAARKKRISVKKKQEQP